MTGDLSRNIVIDRSCRLGTRIALVLLLFISVPFATVFSSNVAIAQGSNSSIDVQVRDGSVTLDVHDILLTDVLRAIDKEAEIAIDIRGDLTVRTTNSFTNVPLEQGLRRLLRGQSFAFSYVPSSADSKQSRLIKVSVVAPPAVERRGAVKKIPGQTRWPEKVRWIQALARQKDTEALGELRILAVRDVSPIVRRQAVSALGRLRNQEALSLLAMALADQSPSVRIQALREIRNLKQAEAIGDLQQTLVNDPHPRVRRQAVRLLSTIQSPEVPWLLQRAEADYDAAVGQEAKRAVKRWWQRFGARIEGAGVVR